jgi:hypothetical protein
VALIWAEGFEDEKALAPLWRRYESARAQADDEALADDVRQAAFTAKNKAKKIYDAVVKEATAALAEAATTGKARTHVIIIGVGRYQSDIINPVTTSVYGAWKFAEWILTKFRNLDRPLGSVEMLASTGPDQGEWRPAKDAAKQLGLTPDSNESLPTEAATLENIKNAFERWLARASSASRNAAFFYFSGHGIWKNEMMLLPEDAQLPTTTQKSKNFISVGKTQMNMFNSEPSVQCFFLDACQDTPLAILLNVSPELATPLCQPSNGPHIPQRDIWSYRGSTVGQNAYGPKNKPPYFTQELMLCLERRAADATRFDHPVTTSSLWRALEAAAFRRSEIERMEIKFSISPGACDFTAELSHVESPLEVFVMVRCRPLAAMPTAKLYIESRGKRICRSVPLPREWYISVKQGNYRARAEFDQSSGLAAAETTFRPVPPLFPVQLEAQALNGRDGHGENS